MMRFTRTRLLLGFAALLAWAQFRESGDPKLSAHLTLEAEPRMPVRVYLFKEGRPFRLSPVDAMLPLRIDLLYRERMSVRSGSDHPGGDSNRSVPFLSRKGTRRLRPA